MREPRFWRHDGVLARLLTPAGLIYGAVAARRMRQAGSKAKCPVICVGNFTVGGAGKTPTAIAIAKLLQAEGLKPLFLSRGYGGAQAGPVRVGPEHRAVDVGDEPLLLARIAPTIVARDRVAGAATATESDVIVMDDGFQNPSLAKDFSLVVVDGADGVGNGRVFPAGPLRAPLATQLTYAQALLVVGEPGPAALAVIEAARARGLPVLRGRLAPDPATIATLAGRNVLAFAGIGHPEKFFATLKNAGIAAPIQRAFADHHRYTSQESAALVAEAARDALTLLTTEKDLARIASDAAAAPLATAAALPVRLTFDAEVEAKSLILAAVQSSAAAPATPDRRAIQV